jgi:hypothetical protein
MFFPLDTEEDSAYRRAFNGTGIYMINNTDAMSFMDILPFDHRKRCSDQHEEGQRERHFLAHTAGILSFKIALLSSHF